MEILFGNCGVPSEVLLFFRLERNSGNFLTICLRWCLHDTGATFIPARVHTSSLLWLCIRLHDTTTKCHAGASHTGASSLQFLCQGEIFIPARKFISVSYKRGMTVHFIFIEVLSILRHYKSRFPINRALCKHRATFHLVPEWKLRRYHVNTPLVSSFQSLISPKKLRKIELQMVSAILFGWFVC